jgi:hypothetical protein
MTKRKDYGGVVFTDTIAVPGFKMDIIRTAPDGGPVEIDAEIPLSGRRILRGRPLLLATGQSGPWPLPGT